MKRIALIIIVLVGLTAKATAQQIPLRGVVTVQNSKTYTGKTQFVKNAEVTHPKAKSEVTDDDGKFTLIVSGEKEKTQIQILVIPHGEYTGYVVVNEKALNDITLGRETPVGVYICKKSDLEQRQAEMVGINMRKLEERMELEKSRLQKELEELRAKNEYLNDRYSEIQDSLRIINEDFKNTFERIKEYATILTYENLDDRNENYVKAYECFARGELDSVAYHLSDEYLDLKYKKVLELQQEVKHERVLASILTESARVKEELAEERLSELKKEWLLLANTYEMKYDYEKVMFYYEKVIEADLSDVDNIFNYANYLQKIREYSKAKEYYLQCLEILKELADREPQSYLGKLGTVLHNLAELYSDNGDYIQSSLFFEQALDIRRKLVKENPEVHLSDLTKSLSGLGNIRRKVRNYEEALLLFEEALESLKKVEIEKSDHESDLANILKELGFLYYVQNEYEQALPLLSEALDISRTLAFKNPQTHNNLFINCLNDLAIMYAGINEHQTSVLFYKKAVYVLKQLADENPKTHLNDLVVIMTNLAQTQHDGLKDYESALTGYEEALDIARKLATENPIAYNLAPLARVLRQLSRLYRSSQDYTAAQTLAEEALSIYRTLAEESPDFFLEELANTLNLLAFTYKDVNDSLQIILPLYKEASDIFHKLKTKNTNYQEEETARFNYLLTLREIDDTGDLANYSEDEILDIIEWFKTSAYEGNAKSQKRIKEFNRCFLEVEGCESLKIPINRNSLEDFAVCFLKKNFQLVKSYSIHKTLLKDYTGLVYLILTSPFIDSYSGEQNTFNNFLVMDIMNTTDEIEKLYEILIKEKENLYEINIKYLITEWEIMSEKRNQ